MLLSLSMSLGGVGGGGGVFFFLMTTGGGGGGGGVAGRGHVRTVTEVLSAVRSAGGC